METGKSSLFVLDILMELIRASCALPRRVLGGGTSTAYPPPNFHRRTDQGHIRRTTIVQPGLRSSSQSLSPCTASRLHQRQSSYGDCVDRSVGLHHQLRTIHAVMLPPPTCVSLFPLTPSRSFPVPPSSSKKQHMLNQVRPITVWE